jgi:hypothetical protein
MDEGTKGEMAENQEIKTNELFSPNENFGVQVLTSDFTVTVVNDDDGNSSVSKGRSSMNL